jgi:hypothetical protein
MSDERSTGPDPAEEGFFGGQPGGPAREPPARHPARRRESPLLARSPVLALALAALSGWLLFTLWPDLSFFVSSRAPIDLGGPGAYRLEAARENRLVQIRGELVGGVPVAEGRTGATRTVGRLAGTNLLVDRPGRGGPPVFEGRLLPAGRRDAYAEVAGILGKDAAAPGEGWQVLRDGERPRRQWLPVLGAALLLAILAVNLRALLRPALIRLREPR